MDNSDTQAKSLSVVDVPIDSLKFASYNPRTIDRHEFESLQRSIDEFGWVEPVVVNRRNMTIVGGHQRVRAAREVGLVTVPVVYVDLDSGREKALNIALNKISGEFDNDLLAELLTELDDELTSLTGFTDEEIDSLQDGFVTHDEDGPKVDKPKVARWTLEELKTHYKRYTGPDNVASFLLDLERSSDQG